MTDPVRRKRPRTSPAAADPRYARLRDLLELAVALQGSLVGLSLDDIAARYEVSRRTASRMLHSLREALGEGALIADSDAERRKRWRMRAPATAALVRWEADDLATLEGAAGLAERDGRAAEARSLRRTIEKLRALMTRAVAARLDPDVEALIESQGFAMRAGPRPALDLRLVGNLREAILAFRKVELHHDHRGRGELRRHVAWPLGFLYGSRHYLVAWSHRHRRPVLFRLSRIARARLLREHFEAPADFDLRRFAENSFGVFQEQPVDVLWRFAPEAADEAREYRFHPRQTLEEADDGALLVRFRAGGLREMAWHLFTWGPLVEVLEPEALRSELLDLLTGALARHRRRARKARPTAAVATLARRRAR